MNNILLVTSGYKHTLYNSLINHPPEGLNIQYGKKAIDKKFEDLHKRPMLAKIAKFKIPYFPFNYYKNLFFRDYNKNDFEYLFTSGFIPFTKKKWVSDCEHFSQYTGYYHSNIALYKRSIVNRMKRENCMGIFSWTSKGANTIKNISNDVEVKKKTRFLPITLSPDCPDSIKHEKTRFIFITSINLPFDYKIKGGEIALKAFNIISDKYDNIELVIRSQIPNDLKRKYSSNKKISFIDESLSFDQYSKLIQTSDALLFPSFHTPGVIFIEMMKYGIPIITSSVWANEEMVINDHNGKIIDHDIYQNLEDKNELPLWNNFQRQYNDKIIAQLSKKYSKAIEDYILDKKAMENHGKKGNEIFRNGRYSLKNRNKILMEIEW